MKINKGGAVNRDLFISTFPLGLLILKPTLSALWGIMYVFTKLYHKQDVTRLIFMWSTAGLNSDFILQDWLLLSLSLTHTQADDTQIQF